MKISFKDLFSISRYYTFPLSLTGVTCSYLHANIYNKNCNKINIYILCVLTSISLQILSNFANDYGDEIKGMNSKNIIFLKKKIGKIFLRKELKKIIYFFSMTSFIFGLFLIYNTLFNTNIYILLSYIFGLLFCIYSSISYSIGKNPYGFIKGLGDISVLFFFGFTSVIGSYFLYTNNYFISIKVILLSLSIGFMSVSVFNTNNIRDIKSDYKHGKITLASWISLKYAKLYQFFLILISIISGGVLFFSKKRFFYQYLFYFIIILLLVWHIINIFLYEKNKLKISLTKEIKKLSLITFLHGLIISM